jgi:protein-S-isoprenylcysteine O-methyltransferase Ste14
VILSGFGELVRLTAVHHIGVISRTRSERLGPLIVSGPFGVVRNPLYVGNVLIWVGFALTARLVWAAPVVAILLLAEYHAIVRWEERLLESRHGDAYRAYVARVPRWWPGTFRQARVEAQAGSRRFSLRETLFSERGTLIAILAGYLLLWTKARF